MVRRSLSAGPAANGPVTGNNGAFSVTPRPAPRPTPRPRPLPLGDGVGYYQQHPKNIPPS